ncbi:hypothetical protein [aff. Roholtiella sp. LEGE 12411]|uniref:hypothetical protein n=1 Tax=aff. Roholtiella sp. LEGE 12411 TaxID=1828822 RepID=UPI00188033CE|nr:hypothetical protein [aff. Roholtiella sp. LEGE 12411]MBE9035585.1 hypothetical protein [aff. Roholtiella sp. LEGE 12411]
MNFILKLKFLKNIPCQRRKSVNISSEIIRKSLRILSKYPNGLLIVDNLPQPVILMIIERFDEVTDEALVSQMMIVIICDRSLGFVINLVAFLICFRLVSEIKSNGFVSYKKLFMKICCKSLYLQLLEVLKIKFFYRFNIFL